jgi:4'-phosphopantetheinyl transferase EntD
MPGHRDPDPVLKSEAAGEPGMADGIKRCLDSWFPSETFVKAARIDDYPILPEERALVSRAVERRRLEFATGRWLARQGLRSFGLPDRPIMMGRLRNPVWPEPVIGAISHDGVLCAVALRRKDAGCAIGIGLDLVSLPQRAGRMNDLTRMFVADASEMDEVATLNVPVDPALLLFSLKESVIKAISFRLDDFIDMRAIEIRRGDMFEIHLADAMIAAELFAAVRSGYLITAAVVR